MKKLLALFLALVMLVSALPFAGAAFAKMLPVANALANPYEITQSQYKTAL